MEKEFMGGRGLVSTETIRSGQIRCHERKKERDERNKRTAQTWLILAFLSAGVMALFLRWILS